MEKTIGSDRRKEKNRRQAIFDWVLTKLVVLTLLSACVISFVTTQATLMEKRKEAEELEQMIEQAKDEKLELEKFVDSDDLKGYMEKAAIEELNYAYPNERRFYDTSRD